MLVISTRGMREFISYVRSAADARAVVDRMRSAVSTHEVQHFAADDGEWAFYRQFSGVTA